MSDSGLNEHAMTKSRVATLKRELFSAKQSDSQIQNEFISNTNNSRKGQTHFQHLQCHQFQQHEPQHLINSPRLTTPTPIAQARKSDKRPDEYHRELSMRKLPTPPGQHGSSLAERDIQRVTASIVDQSQDRLSSDDDDARNHDVDDGNEVYHDEDEDDDDGDDEERDDDDHDHEEENEEEDDDRLDGAINDSADIRIDEPKKPGKLNLSQFDNITNAIGKLTVHQPSASPTSIAVCSQNFTPPHNIPPSSFRQRQPLPPLPPQATTDSTQSSSNSRRLNNPRQHRGRAVAPPTLPSTLLFKQSLGQSNCDSSGNKISSQERAPTRYKEDEDSAIDFSQSPISQRLLKHSKDYKVSELSSPYQSDSEIQRQTISGHVARARELFKESTKNEKSNSNRNLSLDSGELINTRGETIRQLNEILARKPPGHLSTTKINRRPSNDQFIDDFSRGEPSSKKDDEGKKKDKKKLRSDEKLEKRKLKEERLRRQEEDKQKRQEKKLASKKSKSSPLNPDSLDDAGIPLFIRCCIEFIESEGLDLEGIYRVPGNRAHVDTFVHKFREDPEMSILGSDIPVNAVATALKDFLSKKWGPIIPPRSMNELTEISSIPDKFKRMEAVRELVHRLPIANYNLLRYVFSHFVRVSSNHTLNSMDSKNLAICWWPTLLPLQFSDMVMFEQMRPHLEESIQTMIDQYGYIFENEKPILTRLS